MSESDPELEAAKEAATEASTDEDTDDEATVEKSGPMTPGSEAAAKANAQGVDPSNSD